MASKPTIIRFHLSIGFNNAYHDEDIPITDLGLTEEWADMDERRRDKFLDMVWRDWSANYIDGNAYVKEEDDDE